MPQTDSGPPAKDRNGQKVDFNSGTGSLLTAARVENCRRCATNGPRSIFGTALVLGVCALLYCKLTIIVHENLTLIQLEIWYGLGDNQI